MLTPLKPHFYIVKLGFTGVYIIFLISAHNIDCGYSLEPGGGSNEYPQSMFCVEMWKISEFLSENFHFLVVDFLVYLNRLVIVMDTVEHSRNVRKRAYAFAQSDQNLHWAHWIAKDDTLFHAGEGAWLDCANVQVDLSLRLAQRSLRR